MPAVLEIVDAPSDLDKIFNALGAITSIHSVDDVLFALGLAELPVAQRYGIVFGCLTFFLTIGSVMALLVFGGTFKRLQEQEETGEATVPDRVAAREGRPLLLERLLESQARMMKMNYPERYLNMNDRQNSATRLQKMLMNEAPQSAELPELVDENDTSKSMNTSATHIPDGYKDNYVHAYRRCQDKPGGQTLSGLPEARFEAYARAYAGCGMYTSPSYRRSYARMYEAMSCTNHATEKKYSALYATRPQDIHGRAVRLEALSANRHAKQLHAITNGDAYETEKSYNPNEVWGFLEVGPFDTEKDLIQSPVFQLDCNQAGFAIMNSVTNQMIGVIHLSNDNPKNLTIQMELPIVKPTGQGTVEELEACFLALDRLFAHGYRRIQLCIDSQDTIGKLVPGRLGFTQEGLLPKYKIAKDSNIDCLIYGMLNSDWDKGARAFMFKKLHGAAAQRADASNDAKEGELEEQSRQLREKAALEEKT